MRLEDLIKNLAPDEREAKVEESFKRSLRLQLGLKISKLDQTKQNSTINYPNFMNRFKLVLPVAALAVIAIVLVITVPRDQKNKVTLLGKQEVTRLSANGFGQLNSLNVGGRGQGGGGNGNVPAATPSDTKMAAPESVIGSGGGGSGMAVPPSDVFVPTYYKYVYKGDSFEVENDQMDVFEREKGFGATANLNSFLNQFSIGLFDINKLQNATVDYIRAAENRDQGYAVDLDLKAGTIYISQNWEKWAMIDYSQPVTMDQIPSDESAITTANQFLDEYGISRENYGEPEVQNSWRVMYARASVVDQKSMYVPDQVTVVYPSKVSGNEIYDESGNKSGMYVYLNVRNNKVMSVGEITGQKYNASAYPTEKDTKRLIQVAEKGGQYGYYPPAEDNIKIKTTEVELGNPKIVYVRMWQTLNNQSKDIFVPSLMFPIINKPADFYQQAVTVPLIKEVLDSRDNQPIPYPMEKSVPPTEPMR
jgi:hypothetical protein